MATITLNISENFSQLVSKFNELSSGVGDLTGLDIAGESDVVNILSSLYALIDSDTDFRSKISVTDTGGDGSLSYSSSTGVITYTGPSASEVRAHLGSGANVGYDSAAGKFYVTDSTIRGKISVTDAGGDGSLSYSSSTGVITYTGPSASEVRAHFSAGNGISITSGSVAIKSVETFVIYDSAGIALRTLYAAGSL